MRPKSNRATQLKLRQDLMRETFDKIDAYLVKKVASTDQRRVIWALFHIAYNKTLQIERLISDQEYSNFF